MCTILSGQSNLHRRDNEAIHDTRYKKEEIPKLTGTIRLVDHGLNDSTPGVDKPGREKRKRKKFLQLLTRLYNRLFLKRKEENQKNLIIRLGN